MLRADRPADTRSRDQLLGEGQLLTQLIHPHLVRGYELLGPGRGAGPFGRALVMETLTGATLSHLIHDQYRTGMDADEVSMLGVHLCSILGYLHACEVLHLDLEPSNVVCIGGRAVLIDLSLAQRPGVCSPGRGSVECMAPEQVAGGDVSAATYIWGLGGILYFEQHHPDRPNLSQVRTALC